MPSPPANATSEEQAQWLIDNGVMVAVTDPVLTGRRYLVPEAVDNVSLPAWVPPLNVKAPVLTSILPTTATVASLVNLRALGGPFTHSSCIMFNGVALATEYFNSTELRATIPGATQTAGVKVVKVIDNNVASAGQNFTYT